MGKWRAYTFGGYRLGQLGGVAVAVWSSWDAGGKRTRHRFRLDVGTEIEGRAALERFARHRDAVQAASQHTIAAIWTAYIKDRERDGKGMQIYHHNWKALAPRFGRMRPDQIAADDARQYARDRFTAGRAPSTVHTELVRLRQALQWAAQRQIIARAPFVWVPAPSKPRQRVLTEAELLAVLDGCDAPHVRLFAILALTTGARHKALLELTWERVDFAAGHIDLRLPSKVEPMSQRHRKGRAVVSMNNLARAALTEAKTAAVTDHVIEWNGRTIASCRKGLARAVERASKAGKLTDEDITAHTFRHTVATRQWEAGVDPERIAKFLGHSNVATTRSTYAKPDAGYTEPAARVVDLKLIKRVQ